jgi:hypothetical protein
MGYEYDEVDYDAHALSQDLEAKALELKAEYLRARNAGDINAKRNAMLEIAQLEGVRQGLASGYQQHVASKTPPPAPRPPSKEERAARPWDRMDATDALDMYRQSKYCKDSTWDDPHLREGWNEVVRRRARGE